jgi:hypothetical protein
MQPKFKTVNLGHFLVIGIQEGAKTRQKFAQGRSSYQLRN